MTNLARGKWNLKSSHSLPKPVPSCLSHLSTQQRTQLKRRRHRQFLHPTSYWLYSPELALDPTAEHQQILIVSHPKDYCKQPEPEQIPPSFQAHALPYPSPPALYDQPNSKSGEGETVFGVYCIQIKDCSVYEERLLTLPVKAKREISK